MGKGTDKLYITHSEWASEDAYSASIGSGVSKAKDADNTFKRLPFNFCAVSLQPFSKPVCTPEGTVFDVDNIIPWLKKHGTDPVTGKPLKAEDLIILHFAKNDEGDFVDPVTFKVFTNNTHIVALRSTGNVFAYDTIERLNIKAKMWRDLVSDEEFGRKDIIALQDPQNVQSRNLNSFQYIKDGVSTLTPEQERQRSATVNASALGNAASMIRSGNQPTSSTPKVGKYLRQQDTSTSSPTPKSNDSSVSLAKPPIPSGITSKTGKSTQQTSHYTTGRAAASFTSTGLTPDTSGALVPLTDEEYLLRPRRVKSPAYISISVPPHGTLTLELLPEHAPRAVYNMVALAKKGYYNDTTFHRNIRAFMLQGGDPTGTGRGGSSIWGGIFPDEFDGPLSHDRRGMVCMANKGRDTNTSQFFITYAPCKHLDRKHTVFGRVVAEGMDVLSSIEKVQVSEKDKRPLVDLKMENVTVLVDPFEEFLKDRDDRAQKEAVEEEIRRQGGRDDDRTTWTGKRVRSSNADDDDDDMLIPAPAVGKYMATTTRPSGARGKGAGEDEEILEEWETKEPMKKKARGIGNAATTTAVGGGGGGSGGGGGFGNFDNW